MMTQSRNSWWWKVGLTSAFTVGTIVACFEDRALAQSSNIVPDNTLRSEKSIVTPLDSNGFAVDRVDGGAVRGANLFHSFREFNVSADRGAYFTNPVGIENILSRVTGSNPSNILGTLGVLGNANLFLINPNGVIFGQEASLDVGGSFVATTANAIQLGDAGLFSASAPTTSNLLTINPSALFFNAVNRQAEIVNLSTAQNISLNTGQPTFGLQVPNGQSLLLVGGDVSLNSGILQAPGGRVELGGAAGSGSVELDVSGNNLSLSFPNDIARADVSLMNRTGVGVAAGGGGTIAVNAQNLDISGSSGLFAGIGPRQGSFDSQSGDITLNATGAIKIGQLSQINNNIYPNATGSGGNINITAGSLSLADGVQLRSNVEVGAVGKGGNINLTAESLSLEQGVRVSASTAGKAGETGRSDAGDILVNVSDSLTVKGGSVLQSDTFGEGDAGDVTIRAEDAAVSFDGTGVLDGELTSSGVFSSVRTVEELIGTRNSGIIDIKAGSLDLSNRAQLRNSLDPGVVGEGRDIIVTVGSLDLTNSAQIATTTVGKAGKTGRSDAGDILVNVSDSLTVKGGSVLRSNTFGEGDAGSVRIEAEDATVSFDGTGVLDGVLTPSGVYSSVNVDREKGLVGNGKGGNISIKAESLSLTDGAQLNASTYSQGDAGSVKITASDKVSFDGIGSNGFYSGAFSSVAAGAKGEGGDITVTARSLDLANGAVLNTDTAGQSRDTGRSDAGDILVNVSDSLTINDGSQLRSDTFGEGDAGNVTVEAEDATVSLGGVAVINELPTPSSIGSTVGSNTQFGLMGIGKGGDISVKAKSLSLTNGAQLRADTFGQGNAGNVTIKVRDTVSLDGFDTNSNLFTGSGIGSSVGRGPGIVGNGKGGDINITASSLSLTNGAQLRSDTFGVGDAGSVFINTQGGTVSLDGLALDDGIPILDVNGQPIVSGISSSVGSGARGNSGTISIEAGSLFLSDQAVLSSSTSGTGDAGDISVQVDDAVSLTDESQIRGGVEAGGEGKGADIDIKAQSLSVTDGSQVGAFLLRQQGDMSGGQGEGGNIRVNVPDSITLSGIGSTGFSSGLLALSEREASGPAGDITVSTSNFQVADGAIVAAGTFNPGDGGNITINANTFEASGGGQVLTNTRNSGTAGNIKLNIANSVTLSGSDPNFENRLVLAEQNLQFSDLISDVVVNEGSASGLFANTAPSSTGDGGNISVGTTTLNLTDGAQVSARSQGKGEAGNVTINAASLINANNANVTATADKAGGGKIDITAPDIRLRGNSDIRTNVNNGAGGGGDISLAADSIIAFDDSDILAFARDGQGGDIILDTPAFFGENFQPAPANTDPVTLDGNDRVDVNASGAVAGVLTIPDVSFIQNSLTELPDNPVVTETLIANSCVARGRQPGGTFIITGAGGLPVRPGDASASPYPTGTVRTVPSDKSSKPGVTRPWQKGDPIVEPTGAYRLASGKLVMSRECSQQ